MREMIDTIKVCFIGKLQKMLVNLAQILTQNPLRTNINTYLFYYFSQVGIRLG